MTAKKVRVLIVDDSAYNRQTISQILTAHQDIEVIAKASDGEEGLKLVAQHKPDLITLDLEMPRMDGFTFLRILMSKMPTPVIVISSHSRKQSVFQALELGALDFIAKPTRHISPELSSIREELVQKTLLMRHLRMEALQQPKVVDRGNAPPTSEAKIAGPSIAPNELRLIAIGASTGGPPAVQLLLSQLPSLCPATLLVCQHMPAKFTKAFAERLDKNSKIIVKEAEDQEPLLPGQCLISPGGVNLLVSRVDGRRVVRLVEREIDDRYVPSIDRMFMSAAESFHQKMLAVVLTGMGTDGKLGAQRVKERGGTTIAESKESAVIYGMPKEVVEGGFADLVLPLPKISDAIASYFQGKKLDTPGSGR